MGGIETYLNMCGTEIWNRERTYQYARHGLVSTNIKQGSCASIPDLIACVEDQPPVPDGYRLPELDPAPWYDPAIPESWNFAGLLVLEAKLSTTLDRRLTQNIGHGGTLTRARFGGRTLDVHGVLLGKTCCAVTYGLRWLTQALLGSFCGECEGCDMTFLTCCPVDSGEDDCLVMFEDGAPVPYYRSSAPGSLEWQRGSDFARQMFAAGLISGPDVVACHGSSCGCTCSNMTEVDFTIGIGNPWLYRLENVLASEVALGHDEEGECDPCAVTFVKSDDCVFCPDPGDCGDDPDCGDPPIKPPVGNLPQNECGCIPLHSKRVCVPVPASTEWFEQALIIELYAGASPLRNVQIRAFQNPLGYDCCDAAITGYFDDCAACATLLVDYVPAYGTLVFDSAKRRVTLDCQGHTRSATKNLSTTQGLPFRWFEFGCQDSCVMFDVDCENVAADATATVRSAGREL